MTQLEIDALTLVLRFAREQLPEVDSSRREGFEQAINLLENWSLSQAVEFVDEDEEAVADRKLGLDVKL